MSGDQFWRADDHASITGHENSGFVAPNELIGKILAKRDREYWNAAFRSSGDLFAALSWEELARMAPAEPIQLVRAGADPKAKTVARVTFK